MCNNILQREVFMAKSKKYNSASYHSDFAMRLRELLAEQKIPQGKLAENIGVTRQAINAYCLGTSIPDIEKLCDMADS